VIDLMRASTLCPCLRCVRPSTAHPPRLPFHGLTRSTSHPSQFTALQQACPHEQNVYTTLSRKHPCRQSSRTPTLGWPLTRSHLADHSDILDQQPIPGGQNLGHDDGACAQVATHCQNSPPDGVPDGCRWHGCRPGRHKHVAMHRGCKCGASSSWLYANNRWAANRARTVELPQE
jgi:hypothetical protein